ncbi:hypothetical protein BRD06_12505 [Halobacteriales archaeon QS_9_67_15]|nr:MAG: hypothetical protein BRD06_12505 [Halobacteriales archaeon QS_9_67_15]
MKRRTFVRALPAAGALALTGCLSEGSGEAPIGTDEPTDTAGDDPVDTATEPGDESDTPSDTPTESPTETLTERPEGGSSTTPSGVAEKSLTVTDSGCGERMNDASVAFDEASETVTVTGTIWGNNACYTAVLSGVALDDGTLTVVVASESDAGTDEACAQCITEIGYEVTVTLDGGLPDEVAVVHDTGDEKTRVTSTSR